MMKRVEFQVWFTVMTEDGWEKRAIPWKGYEVIPGLVVHRRASSSGKPRTGWQISHKETGHLEYLAKTRKEAVAVAEKLADAGDWTQCDEITIANAKLILRKL